MINSGTGERIDRAKARPNRRLNGSFAPSKSMSTTSALGRDFQFASAESCRLQVVIDAIESD